MAKERRQRDVIIIGGGLAGLTAALYAGRMNLSVLVLESALVGGQIVNATAIENYPGFAAIKGSELVDSVQQQAEHFGAVIDEFDGIQRVDLNAQPKVIETDSAVYEAGAVIIASGMMRRKLVLPEVSRYEGKGIHYCELCDGYMYDGKTIAVIGGGNAAVDAANFLTKYAHRLYVIHRSESLQADEISKKRLLSHPEVEVLLNTELQALHGDGHLDAVDVVDKKTSMARTLPVDGVFVNIGVVPNTEMFREVLQLDAAGNVVAGEDCRTNVPGVFAAGDVRTKPIRQLTTAAADGTVAALLAEKYLNQLKEEK
jgi:thioredoxin reductase (NADPH)